jgi:hypothetical protein
MKVSDAMTPEVQLCTPDDTLKDAAQTGANVAVTGGVSASNGQPPLA